MDFFFMISILVSLYFIQCVPGIFLKNHDKINCRFVGSVIIQSYFTRATTWHAQHSVPSGIIIIRIKSKSPALNCREENRLKCLLPQHGLK